MSSNKHLDTIKSVEKTEEIHIGGLEEMDHLAMAASAAEAARRKYIITFDATGSMSSYWHMAQSAVYEAVKQLKKRTHVPLVIKIVAYRDKDFDGTGFKDESEWSDDEKYLRSFISNIRCYGGGDEEESIEVPLEIALKDIPHQVIMLGDAPGKHRGQLPTEFVHATQLGGQKCPVYTLWLTESCRPDFEEIARRSGGKAFKFGSGIDTEAMEDILMVILSQDKALQIEYQPKTLEGKAYLEHMK